MGSTNELFCSRISSSMLANERMDILVRCVSERCRLPVDIYVYICIYIYIYGRTGRSKQTDMNIISCLILPEWERG